MALKRPAVAPAEGLLTEAVLKHAHCTEPPPLTPSHPLRLSCRSWPCPAVQLSAAIRHWP